jgi:hypothetical protein
MCIIIVKRENHCQSLPASNPNIIFEIHGQNISIDHNNSASLKYTVGTIATYKCKNPKQNYSQLWTCTKNSDSYYSWKKNNDIVCEGIFINKYATSFGNYTTLHDQKKMPTESPSKGDLTEKPNNLFTTETAEIHDFDSETQTSDRARSLPSANLPRDLLIGICSFLGFVLIAVLFGILYKNRYLFFNSQFSFRWIFNEIIFICLTTGLGLARGIKMFPTMQGNHRSHPCWKGKTNWNQNLLVEKKTSSTPTLFLLKSIKKPSTLKLKSEKLGNQFQPLNLLSTTTNYTPPTLKSVIR